MTLSFSHLKKLSPGLSEKIPYLKMLVLFGSHARGDTHARSDWDFAALYDE
ncbi:nucleotidyltransferase domain-containing protein [Okeania sp. SIO3I5]|uniref:nucleotidyltransferase domain-containing protein n=1 Tax=Okeania sp. SIO3I5 TaxID=2607805 RepID=UPI0025CEF5D2|nr:nucleotidyltransferase domain-containing protein [Okeania sp. SIO3I5]